MSKNKKGGYFLLHRSIFTNPVFKAEKKYSPREAWIWLIANARFKDGEEKIENQLVNMKRGCVYTNYNTLSERWGWGKGKISGFITELETERMIEVKSERRYTIITICNYEQYQNKDLLFGTRNIEETERGTEREAERERNEEPKKTERHIDERMFLGKKGKGDMRTPVFSSGFLTSAHIARDNGKPLTDLQKAALALEEEELRKNLKIKEKLLSFSNLTDQDKARYNKLAGMFYSHRDISDADVEWMKNYENEVKMENPKRVSRLIKS